MQSANTNFSPPKIGALSMWPTAGLGYSIAVVEFLSFLAIFNGQMSRNPNWSEEEVEVLVAEVERRAVIRGPLDMG